MAGKEDMAEEIDDNAVDYGEDDYTGIIPVIRKYMRPGDNDDVRRALEVVCWTARQARVSCSGG